MTAKKLLKCFTPYGLVVLSRRVKAKIPLYLEFSRIDSDVKDDYLNCITISKDNGSQNILEIIREDIKYPIYVRNNSSDVYVCKNILENYCYSFIVKNEPKYIIDAGANIGTASIFFANKYKEAKIIAIEPEGSNYELLRKNTEKYQNIIALKAALWNSAGEISLFDSSSNYGFTVGIDNLSMKSVKQITKTITISEIMAEFNIDSIDILKIDIEGAEKEVFESSENWINKTKSMIVELHERIKKDCSRVFFHASKKFDRIGCRGDNLFLSKDGYIKMSNS